MHARRAALFATALVAACVSRPAPRGSLALGTPDEVQALVRLALSLDAAGDRAADTLYTPDALVVGNARVRLAAPRFAGITLGGRISVAAATVTLEVQGVCCNVGGSGVLLTETGLIATSARVIEGARRVRVWLSTGEVFDAVGALYYDHRLDLALILIPGVGLPSAPTANSDSLIVGQRLVAIGVPPDQLATVTDGLLSAVRTEDGVRRLRLSVPIPMSSSGGPIVNEQGKVVGLVVAAVRGGTQHFNDGIPINDVGGELGRLQGKSPTPFVEMAYAETAYERVAASSPGGNLALERTNRREWWDQAASDSLAEQELRTIYGIGNSDRSFSAYTLRPLVSTIPTDSWELHIEGGQYRVQLRGRSSRG